MARDPAVVVGRVAATLALLGFAGLAVASGLDRMSLQAPALARFIPSSFRAEAARSSARLSIVRQQPEAALAEARQAVSADPLDPASTALLGAAYLLDGDAPRAEGAFRVAARFGWREAATQLYWYEAAIQSGDLPRAVERADAILRTRPGFPATVTMLEPLESTPAGRAALIARMADRPEWLKSYAWPDPNLSEEVLGRRSVVLAELGAAGTKLGCEAVSTFVQGALQRGARRQAEAVWTSHCSAGALSGGLADGGFEQFGSEAEFPFGWRGQPSGDVALRSVEKAGGNHVLQIHNRSSVSRLVLRQPVSLEPGTYRLRGKVRPGRLAASLGCGQAPGVPAGVVGDIGGDGQQLTVAACERLELGLWLRPGADEVELDEVTLEKIG